MYRFNRKKCRKQQIILLLFLLMVGLPLDGWGRGGSGTKSDPYTGDLASGSDRGLRIQNNGSFYFKNVSGPIIVNRAGLTDIHLYFEGTNNNLQGFNQDGGWISAALDIEGGLNGHQGNIVSIHGDENTIVNFLKCNTPGMTGIKIGTGNTLHIDGTLKVYAEAHSLDAIFGYPGIQQGSLHLKNGAHVFMGYIAGVIANANLPTIYIENYAQFYSAPQEITPKDGVKHTFKFTNLQPGYSFNNTVAPFQIRENGAVIANSYIRHDPDREPANECSFYYNQSLSWDCFVVNNIPSQPKSLNPSLMGAVRDATYFYQTLNMAYNSSSVLYLNTHNYTHSGTLEAKGNLTFYGEGNTLISSGFKFKGTQPMKLSNVRLSGATTIEGKVYVDASAEGNLTAWDTRNTLNGQIYYCPVTLSENAVVSGITTNGTKITDFYQSGKTLYMWLPKGSNNLMITTVDKNISYISTAAQTISAHKTTINLKRYVVAQIGSTLYTSLSDAFTNVKPGQTVTLERDFTQPNNGKLALTLPQGTDKVTFDLNGKELTFSGTATSISCGNGTLLITDGSPGSTGSISGTFTLQGNMYTELASAKLGTIWMNGRSVYRTWVTKLPGGCNNEYINYKVGEGEIRQARHTALKGACLWVVESASPLSLWIFDGNEPIATTSTTVVNSHDSNTASAYPWADIQYGDITVTPGGATQAVTYGSKSYSTTVANAAGNRFPIYGTALSDASKNNNITVAAGSGIAYITLSNITVTPSSKDALKISSSTDIELFGDNKLTGGYNGTTPFPAIQIIGSATTLVWNNCARGHGRLYAKGGTYSTYNSPAIQADASAAMTVKGGTLITRRSDSEGRETVERSIRGGIQKILAGSVDAQYIDNNDNELRPTNGKTSPAPGGNNVYKVAVTTGLDPKEVYFCDYTEAVADILPFRVLPDEAGKVYCWQPAQEISDPKTKVTLTHPVSYEKTEVEVAKVDQNDRNVAPIVIEMTNLETGEQNPFGNLLDAFDAMIGGDPTHPEKPARYSLSLLTKINNLRTNQTVPANTQVSLNLQSFEIAAQNGSAVSFDASASGAYLNITGKGNIKNTFRIVGDVFIDGVVPLTDAVVMVGGEAVFRTLVKSLPVGETNTYTYSYGQKQNVPFFLHDGLACLWLPDYGKSEELRFTVGGSGGSSTEYTAGGITTVTQRTEAIPASPVGVVARVTYGSGSINQAYNTLKEAFESARKASVELRHADVVLHLLTGVSVSGNQTMTGNFCVDLDGKNITSASGGQLTVTDGARIRFYDETVGMKGTVTVDVDLKGSGQLFVPSSVRMNGTVIRDGLKDKLYWRTMVNTRYAGDALSEIIYGGVTYPVISDETCLWLPQNNDSKEEYIFTVGSDSKTVTGYIISANSHDNDMTIGGSSNVARIGQTEYGTVELAFAALTGDGQTIELLKTSSLETALTLTHKVTFELGKYGLTPSAVTPDAPPALTIGSGGQLFVTSKTGTGELKAPLLFDGGLMYIGQGITGDHIGRVTDAAFVPLFRLLVTNLPATIPTGEHDYTFTDSNAAVVSSDRFMVRDAVACLWFPQTMAGTLTFKLGSKDYKTENITINPDHFNLETYGVSDVAQIRNGKKYRKLAEALNEAVGKTVVVLKNAVLENAVSISGSVTLETGDYSITSLAGAQIAVPEAANLRITGKGSISVGFAIAQSVAGSIYSNGNLQVDRTVNLEATSQVYLNALLAYRVNVSGLPRSTAVTFDCSNQTGNVKSSESGELCLWMQPVNQPVNFSVEAGADTYLATGIIITPTHVNPLTITYVEGIAAIDDDIYDTLAEALAHATADETVVLRKDLSGLGGSLTAQSDATLSLDNNRLITANDGLTLNADAHLLTVQNGTLEGAVMLVGDVYMKGSLIMNNARVSTAGKTVWRTFLTLPAGTTSFDYNFGDITATCTNIQDDVACLWLPSSNTMQALTVTAGNVEYALNNVVIASTHGNELDLTGGNDPVAQVDGKTFASLASALAVVTEGGTVTLLKEISLSSVQDITKSLTLDLGGLSFTSGNSGFKVDVDKTLTIVKGMLLGTIRLTGNGSVMAGSDVKVAGIVLNKDNKECYRTLVKIGLATPLATECHWLEPAALTYDLGITQGSDTYEATVPATLTDHNTVLTAYKRVVLGSGTHSWQAGYANTNLVLAGDAVLSLDNVSATTSLHRLTIRDGALVKTSSASGMVVAEEGIRYQRTFINPNQWESVALPFTTAWISAEQTDPVAGTSHTVLLIPATGTGTAGNFWLKTVDANGRLQGVNTAEMTANVSYLMAVPTDWSDKEITFVSGANQLLRRDKVTAVKPVSGFASYANGTFDELAVKEACYLLNADGDAFELTQPSLAAVTVKPFRGYLLADANTTSVLPTLRVGVATDVVVPSRSVLHLYARPGAILVEAQKEEDICIYRFDGSLVRALRVGAGQTEIPLAKGLYIVNRTKVIISQ